MLPKLLLSALGLFIIIASTILGIEIILFHIADYNVYRVLDISFIDLLGILAVLSVQYLVLQQVPKQVTNFWETLKDFKNKWLIVTILTLLGIAIFRCLPVQFPIGIFLIILVAIVFYYFIVKKIETKTFQKALILLLFGAGVNSSLIFWIHEEANEGRHLVYANLLAEQADTIAEKELIDFAQFAQNQTISYGDSLRWEREWLQNKYLASNYRLGFESKYFDSTAVYYQPFLRISADNVPAYWLQFPGNYALSFSLKNDFRRSVYTDNQPYKNLKNLRDYHFAVVDQKEIILANSHSFDLSILDVELPGIGQSEKVEWEGYDVLVHHHAPGKYVLIGEPLSEVQVWLSNFSLFFSLFLVVAIFLTFANLLLFKKNIRNYWQKLSFQLHIQATLITLILAVFFIIAITTFAFLHQNNQINTQEWQFYIAETLRKEILEEQEQYDWELSDFEVSYLAELADRNQCDIDIYNAQGQLLVSSIASEKNSPAPDLVEQKIQQQLRKTPSSILITNFEKQEQDCIRTYFGIEQDQQFHGFVAINFFKSEIGTAQDIPVIMSKLLNVYVFLLLFTGAMSLLLINLLTRPLQLIASRLSNFKLGEQNQKLEWEGRDAIGGLISEYNKMVDKVEKTTRELVHSEREGAWQIMAQQIAHEINNPLTPLRLNIQFLTMMLNSPNDLDLDKIKRLTTGLGEQIDHLARVATQFKLFAKLETPEAQPLKLIPFLQEFADQYKPQENQSFTFSPEINEEIQPTIQIDPQHFRQVLKNIFTNAEQAIPPERNGEIELGCKLDNDDVLIEIRDNGNGIDAEIIDNIFDPKFSTKSSQTGLGLPICRRIVAFYGGDLSFSTEVGEGTIFRMRFGYETNEL